MGSNSSLLGGGWQGSGAHLEKQASPPNPLTCPGKTNTEIPGLCHYPESLRQPQNSELLSFLVFSLNNCGQVVPKCNWNLGIWAQAARLLVVPGLPRSSNESNNAATLH